MNENYENEMAGAWEIISSLLPLGASFCERDFANVMAEFYHKCARYTPWEKAEDRDFAKSEKDFSQSLWLIECNSNYNHELYLTAENINGKRKRYSIYKAFEYFSQFTSEDGTASYTFLFKLFKFLNLVCCGGAYIPYVLNKNEEVSINWCPFYALPVVAQMQKTISAADSENNRTGRQNIIDRLAGAFLNEWVRRKFLIFRNELRRQGDESYHNLLNLFFMGIKIDGSFPSMRTLSAAIDRWLSVLHIDFSAYDYFINIKQGKSNFFISMDVNIDTNTDTETAAMKTPISKCRNNEILRTVMALSNYLPEIRKLIEHEDVALSEERLINFIDNAAALLRRLGITVNLPKSLARELKPRLVVKENSAGGSLVRYLDLDTLQDFQWRIAIGDEDMSVEDFNKLLNEKRLLVSFKNGFVKMKPEELSYLLKRAKQAPPTVNDFIKAHLTGNSIMAFDSGEMINNLFREQDFPVPPSLNAELRPYQKRGYNWICSLLYSGFGCILADDMGLGKTIQSIAVLLRLKEEGLAGNCCLVVAPAALIDNWEKELARFSPSLRVTRYHGKGRHLDNKSDVFLTTYQTVVRDLGKLKLNAFSILLVDEAHLMKNSDTRISRAVKQLRSKYRLALSGTPVENRLEDLRSLFDFILPGYLGDAAKFREQYRIPIEVARNKERAKLLQKITAPFLLRRIKTDKAIIKDLPDKVITNEYAFLEKEQAALYQSVVSDSIHKTKSADPKMRSFVILGLLTSLKQICAHPRVYDKQSPAEMKLSGKAKLLISRLKEILFNGEKTLVFSQYVETLECLERIIKKELGETALIYHGSLSQETRAEIVDKFQGDPSVRILLVSLRAGGLGLNLTAASRVIHYDLWYNPAVENQATDRAFRIGQKRTVFVHRFITKNSFEEKVDAMITSKQELADMTIASGESWITRMTNEELQDLFERCI